MVTEGTSTPLTIICSITFVSALVPISSNFYFNSSVKSFELRVFPSTLSTFESKLISNPAILL